MLAGEHRPLRYPRPVRLVIAKCSVDYVGRLSAHLPLATRLLMVKADGSVSIHADDRAYKPLNWMSPPCRCRRSPACGGWSTRPGRSCGSPWRRSSDAAHELGVDPGLRKDGVEAHLQELLAGQPGDPRRGLHADPPRVPDRDRSGRPALPGRQQGAVAVEIKRRGEIDGVEQLTRYLELLNRDPLLARCAGVFAAQEIKPQARVLATDRGYPLRGGRLRQAARHRARRADPVLIPGPPTVNGAGRTAVLRP